MGFSAVQRSAASASSLEFTTTIPSRLRCWFLQGSRARWNSVLLRHKLAYSSFTSRREAVIQGIGGGVFEQLDFDRTRILNGRLPAYRVPRFTDLPHIEVILSTIETFHLPGQEKPQLRHRLPRSAPLSSQPPANESGNSLCWPPFPISASVMISYRRRSALTFKGRCYHCRFAKTNRLRYQPHKGSDIIALE
jgi:hypothetical protein